MPHCLKATKDALGGEQFPRLDSRALRLSRFAEPSLKEDKRKNFFLEAFKKPCAATDSARPLDRWLDWLQSGLGLAPNDLIFAKLQSRLALHLSGGVMGNANILLDRFGYPYIPGSGVKGIARRAALYALRTWCVDLRGQKPGEPAEPATAVCEKFQTPDELALAILRVFGWADAEWADGRTRNGALRSDFEWAMGEGNAWFDARKRLAGLLREKYRVKLTDRDDRPKSAFAGLAAFLESKPISHGYPRDGTDLDLDVVTCHHGTYYRGEMPVAFDTEDPIPVYFPTAASGITFVFTVFGEDKNLADFARTCLRVALSTFGAGGKTAAGYGWFDDNSKAVVAQLEKQQTEKRAAAEKEVREKAETDRLAALPPPERFKTEYLRLEDQEFAEKGKQFATLGDDERRGYLLALCDPAKKETRKNWRRKKPKNLEPWIRYGASLTPKITLPEP
jgi:CRISPR-associated protein Cmr6